MQIRSFAAGFHPTSLARLDGRGAPGHDGQEGRAAAPAASTCSIPRTTASPWARPRMLVWVAPGTASK
jgi:hypothetical protein